MAQGETFNVMF